MSTFPTGFTTARPHLDDVPEILTMLHASDMVAIGFPDFDESQVTEVLTATGFDPEADSWLVRDPAGRLVCWGYLEDGDQEIYCEAYQHPEEPAELQRTMIALLTARAVERARAKGSTELGLAAGAVPGTEERYIGFLAEAGFEFATQHARMSRPLDGDEKAPVPPEGVVIRVMRPEELRRFDEIAVTTFADTAHPLHRSFEEFQATLTGEVPWDEWLVCEVDGGMVGVLRSSNQALDRNEGWVRTLGVLAAYRGRGLARMLLETAFALYAEKGRTAVGLGVDTTNPTGAYRLYESLGMTPAYVANIYKQTVPV
ncbi:GNAT family N-acetyltransferase [Longispora sp. NPDC051575]|uniref:GNAT family N-acetyltransferase n=1 Tax=Longispora sp. NPDC051575 TaxID=3154943 RepID=UPI003448491E